MQLDLFLKKLHDAADTVVFADTMTAIDTNYDFTPTQFANGAMVNAAGLNSGSCKLFAFALINKLSEQETLACFGDYYRQDVLLHPDGSDHQNIRNFMKTGWAGVKFESMPLREKESGGN